MKLYHFTDNKLKNNILKVDLFGKNFHSLKEKQASKISRVFFYLTDTPQEARFNSALYCYYVEVQDNKLYNLISDNKNLKEKFKNDIDGLLNYIKRHYIGTIYNIGFNVCIIFNNINVKLYNKEVKK